MFKSASRLPRELHPEGEEKWKMYNDTALHSLYFHQCYAVWLCWGGGGLQYLQVCTSGRLRQASGLTASSAAEKEFGGARGENQPTLWKGEKKRSKDMKSIQ